MYLQYYSLSQQLLYFTLVSFALIFMYFKFLPIFETLYFYCFPCFLAKVYQMKPLFSQKHVEDVLVFLFLCWR